MARTERQLLLGLSLVGNGTHKAGWRHPDAVSGGAMNLRLWQEMIGAAEASKIHFLFLADDLAVPVASSAEELSHNGRIDRFEPLTLLAALSATTTEIGLVATISTSYSEPFTVARLFASLDHLSGGRAGWNVVTSVQDAEAANFSRDRHFDHAVRYQRAEEFLEVVTGLWESWSEDAFVRDKEVGRYFDPEGMRVLDHRGQFFSVRGPLNMPRSPQGRPLVTQAGASEAGQDLAARTADVVYTVAGDLAEARTFYRQMKARVEGAGRDPSQVAIMPGLLPIVGSTQDEAEQRLRDLQELIDPSVGLPLLRVAFGDLSGSNLDGPLPPDDPTQSVSEGFRDAWRTRAERGGLTIRQLYEEVAISRGHCLMVGTAEAIADEIELWFESGGCDGFNILATHLPGGLYPFLDEVIPELQRRGLFQSEYADGTLRTRLGFT